jgi:hypothetical protein
LNEKHRDPNKRNITNHRDKGMPVTEPIEEETEKHDYWKTKHTTTGRKKT